MKYICNKCNKVFKQKSNYEVHINKKNKCSPDEIKIDGKKAYKCDICDKIFNQKCNYLVHINRKNKCIKEETIIDINNENDNNNNDKEDNNKNINDDNDDNNKNDNDDNNKNDNDDNNKNDNDDNKILNNEMLLKIIYNLQLKLEEQGNEIKKLKKTTKKQKIINNTNSNNTTNNNTVINNTINIVSHGKEDISKLTKEEIKDILNSGYNCIFKCFLYLYFNDRLPEYQNISYTDKKSIYCKKYVDGKWEEAIYKKIEEELIDKQFDNVTEIKEDNPELFESQFRKNLVEEFIDDRNKYESFETEDRYPEYWNDKMKKEKQIEVKKKLDKIKDDIKTSMLNKSKEIKNNKKLKNK
jgi:hypothetical protein